MVDVVEEAGDVEEEHSADKAASVCSADVMLEGKACVYRVDSGSGFSRELAGAAETPSPTTRLAR